jgi:tryptophan synthase alpha chain
MSLKFNPKPVLVAYFTVGDPDLATSRDVIIAAIDAGAGIIELGVPFTDPVADGPVIQRASERALENGTTLRHVIDLGSEIRRQRPQAGLIIFSYLNPILSMGLDRFCTALAAAGIDGALVTDLTLEEADGYLWKMREHGLATVFLAAPTSTEQRLKAIAKNSSGFIYAVSRLGVTGASKQMSGDAQQLVKRLRKHSKLPIAVGFGISNSDQFAAAAKFADGVVVGSAIVETIERNPGREALAVGNFVRGLKRRGSPIEKSANA